MQQLRDDTHVILDGKVRGIGVSLACRPQGRSLTASKPTRTHLRVCGRALHRLLLRASISQKPNAWGG